MNGFFYFRLDYEKKYKVVISAIGYLSKAILFDTHLNGYQVKDRYYGFGVSIKPSLYNSIYDPDCPVAAHIKYEPKIDEFEHDYRFKHQSEATETKKAA